ncbi:hypothetical protein HZY86_05870 [Aerococcaceae bacterium DSM 111020]|nr:hypothetical protein [Aerococcaceae bacterium DSM 111020]
MKKLNHFPSQELERDFDYIISILVPLDAENLTSEKDSIKLKNGIEEARNQLSNLDDSTLQTQFEEQLDTIYQAERELLAHRGGLALYITKEEIYYYHIGNTVESHIDVSNEPYIIPLIEAYQFMNDYHVLVLNGEDFKLYQGNEKGIESIQIEDDDAPLTLTQALGDELEGGELNHGTFGGPRGSGNVQTFHGHNDTSNEKEIDRENYFRQVAQYVDTHYSKKEEAPLIIYALPENIAVFESVSDSEYLSDYTIEKSGASQSDQEIETEVLELFKTMREDAQQNLVTRFQETTPEFRIENIKQDLAVAAVEGRIEELAIKQGYHTHGAIDDQGAVNEESDQDFVGQLIRKTLATSGKVVIVEDELMPEDLNMVARLRY